MTKQLRPGLQSVRRPSPELWVARRFPTTSPIPDAQHGTGGRPAPPISMVEPLADQLPTDTRCLLIAKGTQGQ
jgi:hypothetical protein